jgi:hypothetical protein
MRRRSGGQRRGEAGGQERGQHGGAWKTDHGRTPFMSVKRWETDVRCVVAHLGQQIVDRFELAARG